MIVKRVVKFNIKKNHVDYNYIKQQLIESKEIYNYANYIIRQIFFKKSKNNKYNMDFVDEYPELKDLFTKYIEEDKQFTNLFRNIICKFARLKKFSVNAKIVQGIVNKLKSDWDSYWALFNLVKNKQYDKKVNIPKYKKQYNLVEYNNQVLSKKKLKLGFIGTTKMKQGFKLADSHKDLHCKCFRIFYKNNNFVCELIYEKEINDQIMSNDKAASIDLGLENLFTVAFNYNKKGISFKGTKLKSINQYFNKEKSKLQSLLPKNQYNSKRINHLFYKREEQLRNIVGFYSNRLMDLLVNEGISTLVIGHNKNWKDKINIGKVNNQNFVSIPFNKIIDIIKYKAEDFGIKCIEQEESYTSKASFLDNDNIPTFNGYKYGYPKYKKKSETHLSYRTNLINNNIKVDFQQNKVKLPKLGWLDAKLHREFAGKIKHATITKLSSDEYYVSICVIEDISFLPTVNKKVGLDLGVKTLCTTSDGVKYNYDFDFSFYENKIKRLQKYLSKKKQGSSRYRALQFKIAKIYQKVTNKKEDTLHKIVSTLVNENQVICVEDLSVKRMMAKNKNKRKNKSKESKSSKNYLSKSISRMSWYTFTRFLEDKCNQTGRTFQKIGKFYPSSQICSCCGYQNKKIKSLSIREWVCPECKTSHDRDVNAAKNVLNEGLSLLEKSA